MIHWGEGGGKEGTVEALLWQRCFLAMLQRLFRESAFLFWAFLIPTALNEHIWGLEIEERIQQLQLLTSNSTVARPWRFFSASFLAELAEKGKAGSSGNQEKPPLAKPNYLGRSRKIRRNPRASKRIERIPCWHAPSYCRLIFHWTVLRKLPTKMAALFILCLQWIEWFLRGSAVKCKTVGTRLTYALLSSCPTDWKFIPTRID